MKLGLQGKTALITGASAGLGYAVAEELAGEGADIVICARNRDRLASALDSLRKQASGRVESVVADLTSEDDRRDLVRAVGELFGGIDILVTNSGGPPPGLFEDHPEPVWMETVEEHLGSVLALVRAFLPGMRERRWGRILTITSIAVKQPLADLILSNTARAAVVGFARSLANEVARDGVTVNNVMPGYTRTARVDGLAARLADNQSRTADDVVGDWVADIPMGRLGTPEEFAGLVAFLASERAGYITGTSIPVDGGWIRSLL